MRSKELPLEKYDSDKVANCRMDKYDRILESWIHKPIVLLELGIYKGGSLLLWNDYFPSGTIVGVDVVLPKEFKATDRIKIFEGSQTDPQFLSRMANEVAPSGFDIIIDDASHLGEWTRIAFWHLFDNHLKPGGLYVIEDWGTGYWDDWADGKSLDLQTYNQPPQRKPEPWWRKLIGKKNEKEKLPFPCHSYGMVGFVKQLIDEQGAGDATIEKLTGKSKRNSKFKEMFIAPGLVFVKKNDTICE